MFVYLWPSGLEYGDSESAEIYDHESHKAVSSESVATSEVSSNVLAAANFQSKLNFEDIWVRSDIHSDAASLAWSLTRLTTGKPAIAGTSVLGANSARRSPRDESTCHRLDALN